MRIIAGTWRGRRIAAPKGPGARPILDRVKTVLFDMLGHRLDRPGRIPPLAVLDLFAGSGALGLEAMSRGAQYALFIERNRAAAALIRRNLDTLGVVEEAAVLEADATTCEFPPPPSVRNAPGVYGLVFVDPPYRMLTGPRPSAAMRTLLERLADEPVVAPRALIVVRHARQLGAGPDLSPLAEVDRRDVGHMTLRFLTPDPARRIPADDGAAPPISADKEPGCPAR